MNEISLPYHLMIPMVISIGMLAVIFYYRKKVGEKEENRLVWWSLFTFFAVYLLIVGAGTYADISSQLNLRKFDLNGNGMFTGAEITPELKVALKKASSDTGRNFSFITGLVFSGIIAFFVYTIGKRWN
jgi:hypothetical protein